MSAFIVSQNHIRALVTGAVSFGVIKADSVTMYGRILSIENYASVNARYGEDDDAQDYDHEALVCEPHALLKLISCYAYQSCEHREWETSEAFRVCNALRDRLLTILGGADAYETNAYEIAPWAIG